MKIVNPKLLKEMRRAGFCELCGLYCVKREPHHLRARGIGGGGVLEVRCNLIALGGSVLLPDGRRRFSCECHHRRHTGRISSARCLEVVAKREGVCVEEITEVMDWMRRTIGRPSEARLRVLLRELSQGAMQLALKELKEAGILTA